LDGLFRRTGRRRAELSHLLAVTGLALLAGCSGGEKAGSAAKAPASAPPGKVQKATTEGGLDEVVLTAKAAERLAIRTEKVSSAERRRTRTVGGEVLVPAGRSLTITAPVAGTVRALPQHAWPAPGAAVTENQALARLVPFAPVDRDLRAQAQRQVDVARAKVEVSQTRLQRAEQLVADRAGSRKAAEDARMESAVANAELAAARSRLSQVGHGPLDADVAMWLRAPQPGLLRQVLVGPGQSVAAGAGLFEVASVDQLWIRVPLYIGDLGAVDETAAARVRPLGGGAADSEVQARPVGAPPSADPRAATADLYFELADPQHRHRPGERLAVTLQERGLRQALVVPWSAVVHDIHGGTWVYQAVSGAGAGSGTGTRFVRRRVEVDFVDGAQAVLSRGLEAGVEVVSTGATELFGLEFGHAK
jgi:RND family efflux transporter MFP subunit